MMIREIGKHWKTTVFVMVIAVLGLVVGCATPKNPALEKARAAYNEANANPDIAANASVPLYEASKILADADKAEKESEKVRLAEIAEKKVQMAKATAEQKLADKKMDILKKEKQDILLETRQREAERAKAEAEKAKSDADRAKYDAERSKIETERKNAELAVKAKEAEMAQKAAEEAKNQSAEMRQQAEAKNKEAQQALLLAQQSKSEAEAAQKAAEEARKQAESAKAEAEQLKKELSDLKGRETDRGLVLTMGDVLFDTGKANLKANAMRNMDKLAEFLQKYPKRNILVEGHTDSRGSESMNLTLSQNRADSVRNALVSRGVEGTRITAKGFGKSMPIADNSVESGRSQNRRVEIIVLKEGKTE